MKIKNILTLVFAIYAHGLIAQNVVNFTFDEGFSNGPFTNGSAKISGLFRQLSAARFEEQNLPMLTN